MTAVELCLCILIVAGAFACVCLGIVFIKLHSTLDEVNHTLVEVQKSLDKANTTINDVNYKLELLNAPIEKVNGIFSKPKLTLRQKTAGLVGAYRAGKKNNKTK